MISEPCDLEDNVVSRFFYLLASTHKSERNVRRGRSAPYPRSKKPGILPFDMSKQQGGRIPLKRAGLCELETVRYGELDGQSYTPLLDGLSNFRPLSP